MDFSISTLLGSLITVGISTVILHFLLSYRQAYKLFRSNLLIGLSMFVFLRLCFPCEFWFTRTIPSRLYLPSIYKEIMQPIILPNHISVSLMLIFFAFWGFGASIAGLRLLHRYRSLHRLRKSTLASLAGIESHGVSVRMLPSVRSPFTFGVFHPVIMLSALKLNDSQRAIIIQHEYQHIRNHDNLIKLGIQLLCCIYWWFPLIYLYARQVSLIIELHVDEQINSHKSKRARLDYMEILIHVQKQLLDESIPHKVQNSFASSQRSELTRRIQFLINGFSFSHTNVFLLLLTVLIPFALTSIIVEPYQIDIRTQQTSTTISSGDFILHKRDGTYVLFQNGASVGTISDPNDKLLDKLKIVEEK